MICLRCGFCCTEFTVPIVDDPSKGMTEGNMKIYRGDSRCPHLSGNKPGEFGCDLHGEKWYKDTPCFKHGHDDVLRDGTCRFGSYVMKCMEMVKGKKRSSK